MLEHLKKFANDPKLNQRIGVLIMEWERSYPHIDVRSQIQWAHNWLLENPKKDKKDYIRFLGNWMRSAEQRALDTKRMKAPEIGMYKEPQPDGEVMSGDDFKRMRETLHANSKAKAS
jgi:hypothetical protein